MFYLGELNLGPEPYIPNNKILIQLPRWSKPTPIQCSCHWFSNEATTSLSARASNVFKFSKSNYRNLEGLTESNWSEYFVYTIF